MRFVVPGVLLLVAAIHWLPLAGALSADRLGAIYGIVVDEPNLELLLRHRAVLFGILAAFLSWAAFHPSLHRLALLGGMASVASFLWLGWSIGPINSHLSTVFRVDMLALVLLTIGAFAHLWQARSQA